MFSQTAVNREKLVVQGSIKAYNKVLPVGKKKKNLGYQFELVFTGTPSMCRAIALWSALESSGSIPFPRPYTTNPQLMYFKPKIHR